jgi:membrane protein DedA with SNARE-associated domain
MSSQVAPIIGASNTSTSDVPSTDNGLTYSQTMNAFLDWFLHSVGAVDPTLRIGITGLAMLLETSVLIGLVIPGDTVVLVAATGTQSTAEYVGLIIAIVLGSLIGESIGFALGHWFGPAIQHSRLGKWIGHKNWIAAERFLEHRGGWAIFLSRFLPVLHSIVPLTAGITGMHYRRFIVWTAPACLVWSAAYVTVGRSAALTYEQLNQSLHFAGYLFVGIILLFVVVMTLVKNALGRYAPKDD